MPKLIIPVLLITIIFGSAAFAADTNRGSVGDQKGMTNPGQSSSGSDRPGASPGISGTTPGQSGTTPGYSTAPGQARQPGVMSPSDRSAGTDVTAPSATGRGNGTSGSGSPSGVGTGGTGSGSSR